MGSAYHEPLATYCQYWFPIYVKEDLGRGSHSSSTPYRKLRNGSTFLTGKLWLSWAFLNDPIIHMTPRYWRITCWPHVSADSLTYPHDNAFGIPTSTWRSDFRETAKTSFVANVFFIVSVSDRRGLSVWLHNSAAPRFIVCLAGCPKRQSRPIIDNDWRRRPFTLSTIIRRCIGCLVRVTHR